MVAVSVTAFVDGVLATKIFPVPLLSETPLACILSGAALLAMAQTPAVPKVTIAALTMLPETLLLMSPLIPLIVTPKPLQ